MKSALLLVSACAVLAVALLCEVAAAAESDGGSALAMKGELSQDADWACVWRYLRRLSAKVLPRVAACAGAAFLATPVLGPAAVLAFPVCLYTQRLEIGGDAAEILWQECM